MAFLDQKERILDVVLTSKGRELLSKNQLRFKYYSFSDEGINYSGSLSSSLSVSSSMDNYIHRDLSFEADQRKNKDLNSFLYTIPPGTDVLPDFSINVDISSSVELSRKFYIDTIILQNRVLPFIKKPLDIVVRAEIPQKTIKERTEEHVFLQNYNLILRELSGTM
jgi:hypothetical protein